MTATDTRKKAREALTGKWGKGALIVLVNALFSVIVNSIVGKTDENSSIRAILNIIVLIINVPISFGLIISFIKLKRGEEVSAFDFFREGFSRFGRAWGLIGNTFIKMIVPVILIIMAAVFMFSSIGISANGTLAINSIKSIPVEGIFGIIIYIAVLIYVACRSMLYSLSTFIAYDNNEMSTKECVEESARLMNGNRVNLFILELSFIGWAIIAAFTLGIGMFFLIPYMQVAIVCFYEQLAGKDDSSPEVITSNN